MSQSNSIELVLKSGDKVVYNLKKTLNSSSSNCNVSDLVSQLKCLKEEVNSKITDLINSSGDSNCKDTGDDNEDDDDDDEDSDNKEDRTNVNRNQSHKRSVKEGRLSKKKRKHK